LSCCQISPRKKNTKKLKAGTRLTQKLLQKKIKLKNLENDQCPINSVEQNEDILSTMTLTEIKSQLLQLMAFVAQIFNVAL